MVLGNFSVEEVVDLGVIDAIDNWIEHDLDPGSYCRVLLQGRYKEAELYAHHHIRGEVHWDHVAYVENMLHGQHGLRAAAKLALLRERVRECEERR